MQNREHVGEENKTFFGTTMVIIAYYGYNNVIVEFQDEYKVQKKCSYKEFKRGKVKNPYDKSVFGIGYIGEGDYPISVNSKATKCYEVWRSMIIRCYDKKLHIKEPSYKDCFVDSDWLCFQTFAKWFDANYYELPNEKTQLDKDIKIPGNKKYGPDTCIFVPNTINQIFIKYEKCINSETNLKGIRKVGDKYLVRGTSNGQMVHIGYYNTIDEAIIAYDNFIKNKIKCIAEKYKNLIPNELYNILCERCKC